MKKYKVDTTEKGTLFFDELPKGTYFLEGYRDDMPKGQAMFFTWDNGTCLLPIKDTKTGSIIIDESRAGKEIN